MSVLEVKNLCKKYPAFELKNVSFSLAKGKITGFIGRNGAGKSTTLKSLFNFVHPDNGEVIFFDNNFCDNEFGIKQRVGFVSGGVDYYSKKKIKTITSITKSFYDKWDDTAYSKYMTMFKLDENKTPEQLSAGMKVKYALTLALSHNAELLILDEPTSGLDPISRDDLLDVFMELCDNGITILFSTHITSDLDKCADNIIYIKNGMIFAESDIKSFVDSYKVLELTKNQLTENLQPNLIGCKRSKNGFSALIRTKDISSLGIDYINADLESIMVHLEKESE
ncbi:ABC transporter ATP-binding protein [Clostridium carboxidivorans P7]|uniref:ABC transporter related protein n=1 Tax=Clostridium carboxidivorans P7 TaxID=536227 RepID=C6PP96_9CLOT|nr:ABC transporter ATP-binding protein [Clostridium carboxidivorans]AKN29933.1 ABC transporter ATP-binding protein [Clostridium carboxidivorans P7]EET88974.1 ABC transporter related protein [Clostridium carboxidivorans P7]